MHCSYLKNITDVLTFTLCDPLDESVKGERENVAEEVDVAALQSPLCPATMLLMHEWYQATEDGEVQEKIIPEILLKGTKEEAISNIDLNSEVLLLFSLLLPTNFFFH